jgi:hypothetical protein
MNSLLSKITFDNCKTSLYTKYVVFQSKLRADANMRDTIEHTEIFPQVCDYCGEGFSRLLEYFKHLNSHLSEEVYLCQYRTN